MASVKVKDVCNVPIQKMIKNSHVLNAKLTIMLTVNNIGQKHLMKVGVINAQIIVQNVDMIQMLNLLLQKLLALKIFVSTDIDGQIIILTSKEYVFHVKIWIVAQLYLPLMKKSLNVISQHRSQIMRQMSLQDSWIRIHLTKTIYI